MEAKRLGKHKTVLQITGIIFIFITLILFKLTASPLAYFLYDKVIPPVMWVIVFITLYSGANYWWINRKTIKTF